MERRIAGLVGTGVEPATKEVPVADGELQHWVQVCPVRVKLN